MRQMRYQDPTRDHAATPKSAPDSASVQPTPGPPLDKLGFDGRYKAFRLPAAKLETYEGRVEFWDRASQTALMVREPTSPYHERPSQVLAALAERIAAVRGKPIRCFGTMDLTLLGKDGRPSRMMQADQSLYLHPDRADIVGPSAMVVGRNHYPDVVLEVDRTTDVRRHKLQLYEAWGFPEVWVDVPDESPHPAKRRGMTIYLREGDALEVASHSRAFPSWAAEEIHIALNEETLSERTVAALRRVGATLGAREGTGPDDDPLLRVQRTEARQEARQEAYQSELERRAALIRELLLARKLEVAADFPANEPEFADASVEDVAQAALDCEDEASFVALLRELRSGAP